MDSLPSLGSFSVAFWPILVNWRQLVTYMPGIEDFVIQYQIEEKVHNFLHSRTGTTVAILIATGAVVHILTTVWKGIKTIVLSTWYSTCTISVDDDLYRIFLDWLSKHQSQQSATAVSAVSDYDQKEVIDMLLKSQETDDNINIQQFGESLPPNYIPQIDETSFWHKGAYFWLEKRKVKTTGNKNETAIIKEFLDIYCCSWNRSIDPIKDILMTIKQSHAEKTKDYTEIYTITILPWSKTIHWKQVLVRAKRPMHTVILGQEEKHTVINDIKEFLLPSGVRWYSETGLPLRLGFLFYGEPGTGKSSFAFALAGYFGLPMYIIDLMTPGMTDQDVQKLFLDLPPRSIVMLEDIDATGLLNRSDAAATPKNTGESDDSSGETNKVTLSGLLNAIDGVASPEGRILIMTTNHIEALDQALIRAGRADRFVLFTNASKDQAENLFKNAYMGERWRREQDTEVGALKEESRDYEPKSNTTTITNEKSKLAAEAEQWTDQDIEDLAWQFAEKITDQGFSPALIQQYLKDFRVEPRRAVRELDEWMKSPREYIKPLRASVKKSRHEVVPHSMKTLKTTRTHLYAGYR